MITKRLNLFAIALIALFNLFSCQLFDREGASWFYSAVSDDIALDICVSYSVPGIRCDELKGPSDSEVIDQDSYGRTLYKYVGYSYITDKIEKAVVVCQKIENGFVYFYEDENYLLYDYTETDLQQLKSRNDWDNPLCSAKMTCGKICVSADSFNLTKGNINFEDRESWLYEQLGSENQPRVTMVYENSDANGKENYTVLLEVGDKRQVFYMICSSEYDICFIEVDETTEEEDFSHFKKECGWSYVNDI